MACGPLPRLAELVLDLRALRERAEAVTRDTREVDERVLPPVVRGDEPEALLVAEPLHDTSCHTTPPHSGSLCARWCCRALPSRMLQPPRRRRRRRELYQRRAPRQPVGAVVPPPAVGGAGAAGGRGALRRRLVEVRVEPAACRCRCRRAGRRCRRRCVGVGGRRRRGRRRRAGVRRRAGRSRRWPCRRCARTCRRTAGVRTGSFGCGKSPQNLPLACFMYVAPDLGRERAAGDRCRRGTSVVHLDLRRSG